MKILEVDGRTVDLFPNTVIAQTLQVFEPGRIGSVVTNYTASVKAPRTRNNEITFGFLTSKTKSSVPYASLSCRYFEHGLPIIRNARIVINEVTDENYSFTIYSGPWGFFEQIEKKTLWDLDFSDINGPWTQAVRDGLRTATTGLVQALVDDGRLVQDQASSAPTIENQGSLVKPPQIYYHTVINKIFQGFTTEGDIFTNEKFLKLVIPLSVVYTDPAFMNAKVFQAAAPGDQVMTNPVTETNVVFDQNIQQGADNFYDEISEYVVDNPDTPNAYFTVQFFTDLTIDVTGGTVDIKIEATGFSPGLEAQAINVGSGQYSLFFQPTTGLKDADVVKITIVTNSGTPTVEILSGTFYNRVITGREDFEFFPTIMNDYVYFQKLFQRRLITDFLRDFCVRFGVQITQINNTLHVNTLNKILDIRTGPNWTDKRNGKIEKIKYLFSSYARTNKILYSSDEEFTPNLTDEYGQAEFAIPNENLKEKATIYTSFWQTLEMINTFGVFMAKLNLEPDLTNFARMPGERMFMVRSNTDTEPPVLYDAIDRTDYLVGYWFDPNQDDDMGFQYFSDTFLQKFIDRCLRKVRLIERIYNLSDLDIYKFNQQEPIWDNSERFLVTKIVNRVSGKSCKVELLKIDANPEHVFFQGTGNNISGALEDTIEIISNNLPPILDLAFSLIETVTGNPTWQVIFTSTEDTDTLTAIGTGASDSGTLDHNGMKDVDADVLKTNNDGFGTDGFPTATGWVEWLRNGVQVNTAVFDSSGPSSSFGLNFTYVDVKAWEDLEVIVHEDGTTP